MRAAGMKTNRVYAAAAVRDLASSHVCDTAREVSDLVGEFYATSRIAWTAIVRA